MHLELQNNETEIPEEWTTEDIAKKVLGLLSLVLIVYFLRTEVM